MTATEYAKQFENFPTYHKIAMDAFKAGLENAKTPNIQKLEKDLKEAKKELKHLWNTLEDPEECWKLLAGL
jgi:predicted RNase H-like nuclease (RuvC/YqgF family)